MQQHYAHGTMLAQESKENLSNRIFEVNLMVPCYSANFQEKKKRTAVITQNFVPETTRKKAFTTFTDRKRKGRVLHPAALHKNCWNKPSNT